MQSIQHLHTHTVANKQKRARTHSQSIDPPYAAGGNVLRVLGNQSGLCTAVCLIAYVCSRGARPELTHLSDVWWIYTCDYGGDVP